MEHVKTLIQGGTVVTATETVAADVLVDGEKVAAVGRGMAVEADRTIDANVHRARRERQQHRPAERSGGHEARGAPQPGVERPPPGRGAPESSR